MKETKVYVDELPDICDECPFQNKTTYECVLLPKYSKQPFLQSCPLKSLKTHDRELVKEVCEKIKEQLGFIVDGQERISCDGSATGDKTILAVLDQIQKEFEDGK